MRESVFLQPDGAWVGDIRPRRRHGDAQWEISGYMQFVVELKRPCEVGPGAHTLEIILDGDLCVANLDRAVSLNTWLYDPSSDRLGIFVGEGAAIMQAVPVRTRGPV
jgi:beta-fructofuranosidase